MVKILKNVAFIPLRGGSKSIPLKNIKALWGKPLVYWVLSAANDCSEIDEIVISTDSAEIEECVRKFQSKKVGLFNRSPDFATDSASTEDALLEYFQNHEAAKVVLIQATSPLLSSADLTNGFQMLREGKFDSLVSVARIKRFIWSSHSETGEGVPLNYKPDSRPRRQDFEGLLVENGAFYITSHRRLLDSRCRLSGRIGVYEMAEESFFELDEPNDWEILERTKKRNQNALPTSFQNIKVLASDVDGCLTDAGMYYSERGDELKKFNTRDGVAFRLFQRLGIKVGIITSEDRSLNRDRAKKLGLDFEFHGIENKLDVLTQLCRTYGVKPGEVAYIGDDINDLELLNAVGFSACPRDAHEDVKQVARYCCKKNGGEGILREIFTEFAGRMQGSG